MRQECVKVIDSYTTDMYRVFSFVVVKGVNFLGTENNNNKKYKTCGGDSQKCFVIGQQTFEKGQVGWGGRKIKIILNFQVFDDP